MKELEIIKKAVLIEKEGYEFYKMAAEKATEEDVKDAFMFLANEEKAHLDWLMSLYEDIKADRNITLDIENLKEPDQPKRIFTWKNVSPESGSLAVSVFGIGANMEKNAIDFYRKAAKESEIPEAKALFEKLVDWEAEHMDEFQKNYDQLKEEWWDKQGFSTS
ncbi:ferritin-like domain-containing protein [Desulfuribacillus stibiiarsenatis]|nr:ferritin family protein [Desulfuribacillus stibiiarsenatis]